ncbi:MAG: hypothetical protein JNJ64_04220 [Flavobacteriales bacterium]|nr:hypothetical protein [Flavobacteriales bacterium]
MNPIAIIAFLVGINGNPPAEPAASTKKEETRIERTEPATGKDVGGRKRRGGWDHN